MTQNIFAQRAASASKHVSIKADVSSKQAAAIIIKAFRQENISLILQSAENDRLTFTLNACGYKDFIAFDVHRGVVNLDIEGHRAFEVYIDTNKFPGTPDYKTLKKADNKAISKWADQMETTVKKVSNSLAEKAEFARNFSAAFERLVALIADNKADK